MWNSNCKDEKHCKIKRIMLCVELFTQKKEELNSMVAPPVSILRLRIETVDT